MTTNTKKAVSAIGWLTLTASIGYAQSSQTSPPAGMTAAPPELRPVTIGVEAGTTGPGGLISVRFADHFGARAGADYFSYSDHATIKGIPYNARLQLLSEPVTLDWYPWARHSFHISVGALFNENEVSGSGTGNFTINGDNYTGTANLKIQQQLVDPYVSIGGNLYFDRAHHWSLGSELGAFWTGDPRVSFSSSAPVNANDTQTEVGKVKHYARDAEFWPVLKLSLNYSF